MFAEGLPIGVVDNKTIGYSMISFALSHKVFLEELSLDMPLPAYSSKEERVVSLFELFQGQFAPVLGIEMIKKEECKKVASLLHQGDIGAAVAIVAQQVRERERF